MAREVGGTVLERGQISVRVATVILKRLHCHDKHDGRGSQSASPADDVEEFLHSHVGAEAALRHHVVPKLERYPIRNYRVVTVRDVCEGATVNERGLTF